MKVLLIHPADARESIAPGRFEPLGLETLAATIPDHEVQIIDLRIDRLKKLDRFIQEQDPEVIGMSVNNTIHVMTAMKTLKHIRQINKKARVVVGGHHVTMSPMDFRTPDVDAIFYGWAEKSFPAYISALSNGCNFRDVHGIELLHDGKTLFKSENKWDMQPSEVPPPRRDLVSRYQGKYRSDTGHITSLVNTSRGCPNRCSFCCVWKATQGKFFLRDPEDVFHEIASLPENISYVFFADDNTFINPSRSLALAKLISDAGIRKKYSGYCRSDTIVRYPEMMKDWGKIGLKNLCVGFEVTDDDELKALNKRNLTSNNEAAARILNSLDIPFRPHFLINPDFENEQFQNIRRYVRVNNLMSPIFPILTPIPGSQNYEQVRKKIWLNYNYYDYAHAVTTTRLRPRDFYRAWIKLFNSSYPFWKNFKWFVVRKFARWKSNPDLEEKSRHVNLLNLIKLKVFSIFVIIKLVSHYRKLEKHLKRKEAVI